MRMTCLAIAMFCSCGGGDGDDEKGAQVPRRSNAADPIANPPDVRSWWGDNAPDAAAPSPSAGDAGVVPDAAVPERPPEWVYQTCTQGGGSGPSWCDPTRTTPEGFLCRLCPMEATPCRKSWAGHAGWNSACPIWSVCVQSCDECRTQRPNCWEMDAGAP